MKAEAGSTSRLFLTGIYERSRRSLTLFFLRKLEMALPPYLTISSATMPTGFAKRGFSLGQQSRAHGIGSYLPENGTPRVGNMTLPSGQDRKSTRLNSSH